MRIDQDLTGIVTRLRTPFFVFDSLSTQDRFGAANTKAVFSFTLQLEQIYTLEYTYNVIYYTRQNSKMQLGYSGNQ